MPAGPRRRRTGAREIRRLTERLRGGRLSFGNAIRVGDLTVIPVTRVTVVGGFGFGPPGSEEDGGGGGGLARSRPMGFIEVGPDGSRYKRITHSRRALLAAAGAGALATAAAGSLFLTGLGARALAASVRRRGRRFVRRRLRVRLPLPLRSIRR